MNTNKMSVISSNHSKALLCQTSFESYYHLIGQQIFKKKLSFSAKLIRVQYYNVDLKKYLKKKIISNFYFTFCSHIFYTATSFGFVANKNANNEVQNEKYSFKLTRYNDETSG